MSEPTHTDAEKYDVTPADLAAKYGVCERHITNLAKAGDIPGVRVGVLWRFNAEEVHEAVIRRARTIRQPKKQATA